MVFNELFQLFKTVKVVVVGDVMLDSYVFGKVERISPEAPVPVVSVQKKEQRIGGAGNVALNTVALQAETFIISIIGNDEDGKHLKNLYQKQQINCTYLIESNKRITTNKTRIIGHSQQMMRLDAEITHDISTEEEENIIAQTKKCIEQQQPKILIFEDYNKGVLTPKVIEAIIGICKANNVLTAVDPKRKNFFAYKGVDIFKPNLKEVNEGLNLLLEEVNENSLTSIHNLLQQQLQHHTSFITLSEKGVFYSNSKEQAIIPTHVRSIADVSGAGDTVIAVASLVFAATNDFHLAAEIANIAGGLVCEEVGTAAIDKDKLLAECELLLK